MQRLRKSSCLRGPEASEAQATTDPVDLGAPSDLIGAQELMSIEAVLAAPNGGLAGRVKRHYLCVGDGRYSG